MVSRDLVGFILMDCVRILANLSEIITERMQKWCSDSDNVLAVMIHDEENGRPNTVVTIAELPVSEKLEKFVEDVK